MSLPAPPGRVSEDGHFPFGQINEPRPAREPEKASRVLVLGVYPSAVHVKWSLPAWLGECSPSERGVAAMAVDVEPCVFWSGDQDTTCAAAPDGVEALVAQWQARVGLVPGEEPGQHGRIEPSPLNGPSGSELNSYFDGIGIPREQAVLADVYPVFLVHRKGVPGGPIPEKDRQQGDAIAAAYDPVASQLERADGSRFAPSTLPIHPSGKWALPDRAVERFGGWIRSLILESQPELIVTLGQIPWDTLERLGAEPRHAASSVSELRLDGYGTTGSVRIDDHTFDWMPLAHPGLLMRAAAPISGPSWRDVHSEWIKRGA